MFPTTLEEFKIQHQELERQAAHQRLVRSFKKPNLLGSRISILIGRALLQSGQLLLRRAQAAQY